MQPRATARTGHISPAAGADTPGAMCRRLPQMPAGAARARNGGQPLGKIPRHAISPLLVRQQTAGGGAVPLAPEGTLGLPVKGAAGRRQGRERGVGGGHAPPPHAANAPMSLRARP